MQSISAASLGWLVDRVASRLGTGMSCRSPYQGSGVIEAAVRKFLRSAN